MHVLGLGEPGRFIQIFLAAMYFSVKNIPTEKRVDHILLLAGEEGLRKYNAWTFENHSDRADPEIIWRKFEEQREPQINFHIARFYLREYKQKNTENIDDFVARCKLQAKKKIQSLRQPGNWRTAHRTGTRHPELMKLLLSKGIELTLQEALNSGRTHEASLNHMKQMAEIQGGDSQEINTIKQSHCKRLSERKIPSLGYYMFGLWKKESLGKDVHQQKWKQEKIRPSTYDTQS